MILKMYLFGIILILVGIELTLLILALNSEELLKIKNKEVK